MEVFIIILAMALFGWIGHSIPKNPDDKFMGGFLGCLLGPLGLIIVAIINR